MNIEEIGNKLREIRRNKEFRLADVEAYSGYSVAHICAMERGKKMSLTSLINILETYGYELKIEKKEMK